MSQTWHVVTCEYPPQIGGVADFCEHLARGLVASGAQTTVWSPGKDAAGSDGRLFSIRRELGRLTRADFRRVGLALDECQTPRRVIVQWVPHGYGYRSLNVFLPLWIAQRSRQGDTVELIVHEPFLAWSGSVRVRAAAAVHRAMLWWAARRAHRLWITIPAWEERIKPFVPADVPIQWLPVPSTVDVVDDASAVLQLRTTLGAENTPSVGHFGTFSPLLADVLSTALKRIAQESNAVLVLMGHGSREFAERWRAAHPDVSSRVRATGALASAELSLHIQACDVLLQPYPDGVSSRRTTAVTIAAHQRAIVTNDGDLTDQLWRSSGAVSLVQGHDPDEFANAVISLLLEPERRRALALTARRTYESVFSDDILIQRLLATTIVAPSTASQGMATP